ncbi:MAG: RnfH family protein [Ectothiorhodospiraceae bacterium]|nr:RnfH family protein [Ectothiorhodospiraceae bacterium]
MASGADKARVAVQVAYATPERQVVLDVEVPAGSTAEEVIRLSGVLERFPEIDLGCQAVGIFGREISLADTINAGDRVEIYRPLIADPREVRRQRARLQRRR